MATDREWLIGSWSKRPLQVKVIVSLKDHKGDQTIVTISHGFIKTSPICDQIIKGF